MLVAVDHHLSGAEVQGREQALPLVADGEVLAARLALKPGAVEPADDAPDKRCRPNSNG